MVLLIIIVSILVITRNQCELELYHIKSQVCRNLLEETSNDIRTLEKNLYMIFLLFFKKYVNEYNDTFISNCISLNLSYSYFL